MKRFLSVCGVMVVLASLATTASAGGGCHEPFTDGRTTTVQLKMNCFNPTIARVDAGDTVTFKNVDGTFHAVGGIGDTFGGHAELRGGESLSYDFNEEGVFPYVCIIHAGMGGAIVVGDGEGELSVSGMPDISAGYQAPAGDGSEEAAAENGASAPVGSSSDRGWMVGAGIAIGLVLLVVAALPRRRSLPQL